MYLLTDNWCMISIDGQRSDVYVFSLIVLLYCTCSETQVSDVYLLILLWMDCCVIHFFALQRSLNVHVTWLILTWKRRKNWGNWDKGFNRVVYMLCIHLHILPMPTHDQCIDPIYGFTKNVQKFQSIKCFLLNRQQLSL